MAHLLRQAVDLRAPIEWSPDSRTVDKILTFCEYEVARLRSPVRMNSQSTWHTEAREAILERIYGNLRNVTNRTYPSQISFSAVASDLTKHMDESHDGIALKAGYVVALESEWGQLRDHFRRHFPRLDID